MLVNRALQLRPSRCKESRPLPVLAGALLPLQHRAVAQRRREHPFVTVLFTFQRRRRRTGWANQWDGCSAPDRARRKMCPARDLSEGGAPASWRLDTRADRPPVRFGKALVELEPRGITATPAKISEQVAEVVLAGLLRYPHECRGRIVGPRHRDTTPTRSTDPVALSIVLKLSKDLHFRHNLALIVGGYGLATAKPLGLTLWEPQLDAGSNERRCHGARSLRLV